MQNFIESLISGVISIEDAIWQIDEAPRSQELKRTARLNRSMAGHADGELNRHYPGEGHTVEYKKDMKNSRFVRASENDGKSRKQ